MPGAVTGPCSIATRTPGKRSSTFTCTSLEGERSPGHRAEAMYIRALTTLDDCRKVTELEKTIWGYTDAEDVVPPPVLIVSIKRGGVLLGAFDEAGLMKGFVYSIPGIKHGKLIQWSHMLGVTRDARDAGLGLRRKLAQRERSL